MNNLHGTAQRMIGLGKEATSKDYRKLVSAVYEAEEDLRALERMSKRYLGTEEES